MRELSVTQGESYQINTGRWGSIDKEERRAYDLQTAVEIPLGQGVVAFVAVGLPAVVVLWLLVDWKAGLIAGALAGSAAFAYFALQGLVYVRDGLQYSEYWESESLQANAARSVTQSTVRVELVDNSGAYPRYVYDQLHITDEALALVARPDTRLSKRGLMELGLGGDDAMNIVGQLLALGYAERQAGNEPAQWTTKGMSLCRRFAGGGGGGGALETSKTGEIVRVGEG